MARKRIQLTPKPSQEETQDFCCCSCQCYEDETPTFDLEHAALHSEPSTSNFDDFEPRAIKSLPEEDPYRLPKKLDNPRSLPGEAHQKACFKPNHDINGLSHPRKSRASRSRHSSTWLPWTLCSWSSNMFLCFLISLLFMSLLPDVRSDSVNYTPDEKRLIRGLFLRKFGLEKLVSETPAPDTPIPEYLWELYQQVDEGEAAEVVRHYYPVEVKQEENLGMNGWLLRYNLSATNQDEREALLKADLRIKFHEELHDTEDCDHHKFNVYEVGHGEPKMFKLLDEKELKSVLMKRNKQWIDLDVTDALFKKNPSDDIVELFIEYTSSNSGASSVQLSDPEHSAALVAYYEYSDEEQHTGGRQKRSPRRDRKKHRQRKHHHVKPEAKNQCRRTNLYVDFSELNWRDWIVAPNGYEAYQCQGHCPHPLPSNLNTTNHAIIQSLIHSLDPSIVPPPSCVPTEMSSVTILYRDINNAIMMKVYPDMVVDACGCR